MAGQDGRWGACTFVLRSYLIFELESQRSVGLEIDVHILLQRKRWLEVYIISG
jgi:hypothetical protein